MHAARLLRGGHSLEGGEERGRGMRGRGSGVSLREMRGTREGKDNGGR